MPTEHGTVCGYRLSCYLSACRISRRLVVGTKWSRDKGPGPSRGGRLSLSAWPASGHLSWPPGYWVKGSGSKKMACFLGDPPATPVVHPFQRVRRRCRSPDRAGAGRLRYRRSGILRPAGQADGAPEPQGGGGDQTWELLCQLHGLERSLRPPWPNKYY